MKENLKINPCQCGAPGYLYHYDKSPKPDHYYMVWCSGECDISNGTGNHETKEQAIEEWNNRLEFRRLNNG